MNSSAILCHCVWLDQGIQVVDVVIEPKDTDCRSHLKEVMGVTEEM